MDSALGPLIAPILHHAPRRRSEARLSASTFQQLQIFSNLDTSTPARYIAPPRPSGQATIVSVHSTLALTLSVRLDESQPAKSASARSDWFWDIYYWGLDCLQQSLLRSGHRARRERRSLSDSDRANDSGFIRLSSYLGFQEIWTPPPSLFIFLARHIWPSALVRIHRAVMALKASL